MAHAEFSASGSDRWLNCPGSIQLARLLPRSESSIFAKEGTAAHALCETLLRHHGPTARADCMRGYYIDIGNGEDEPKFLKPSQPFTDPPENVFLVDEEMVEGANIYLDTVYEVLEVCKDPEMLIEARLDLSYLRPDMFGTGDCIIAEWLGTLYVIDFKYGKGVGVEAVGNSQLKYYGLGAAKLFDFQFEKVCLIVVQPRFYHSEGPVRSHTISMEELKAFEKELAEGYDRALREDPVQNPGSHCKFCPALGIPPGQTGHCAGSWKKAEETAKLDFAIAPPLNEPESEVIPVPSDPAEISLALKWLPFIDGWVKKVAATAETMALQGMSIPGYKLVEKRTIRRWSDFANEAEIKEELQKKFPQLKEEDFYDPPKLKTPPKIEKLLKAAEKRELAATGLVVKPEGALTLVSEEDRREEKVPQLKAATDFEGAPGVE